MRAAPILLGLLALSGCNAIRQSTSMFPNRSRDWHRVATSSDQKRLRDWRSEFVAAVTAARRAGHGADVDREGALLQPDAALAGAAIPNGLYRCRLVKVGAKGPGDVAYAAKPFFTCRVSQEGSVQGLVKVGGPQRIMGLVFAGDPVRQVFLGTLMLPDESRAMQYGADENRDIAGYVERIGPARWRLVMPAPHFASLLDVLELAPLSGENR
jgi:Domain of unknown function (DUF4893)